MMSTKNGTKKKEKVTKITPKKTKKCDNDATKNMKVNDLIKQ